MNIPGELYYSKTHHWIRNEGSDLRIGLTDYGQDDIDEIVFVELPELDEKVSKGEPVGTIESVNTVTEIYAPVTGTVVAINSILDSPPELIKESSYQKAWMIVIEASDEDELDTLLSADEYKEHLNNA